MKAALDVAFLLVMGAVLVFCLYNLVFLWLSLRVLDREYREHQGYFDAWKAAIARGDWGAVAWYEEHVVRGFPKLRAFERRFMPWYARTDRET